MSVDAIQQVIQAEEQAEKILQETRQQIEERQKISQELLAVFHKERKEAVKQEQKEKLKQQEREFETLKAPVVQKTTGEIQKLQQVSPSQREQAIRLMLEAVVN
ncbi:hypothetical protein ACYSNO_09405 [Enterococcus sp. LJL98]